MAEHEHYAGHMVTLADVRKGMPLKVLAVAESELERFKRRADN